MGSIAYNIVDSLIKDGVIINFYVSHHNVDKVGVEIYSEEPATLWVSKATGRVIYRDLVSQGYVGNSDGYTAV